jgi:hypothetical protein
LTLGFRVVASHKRRYNRAPLQKIAADQPSPELRLGKYGYRHSNLASPIVRAYRECMNPKIICLLAALSLAVSGSGLAAGSKTYQITGTVVEATGSKVTVEKGTDRFEFDIDPAAMKGSAELKVGSTVTVTYVMSATKIESAAGGSSPAATP